ncbi:hypothetical protein [Sphingobacterium paludis]|uniref:Uncharacterized protein n=1 Tax=Sphingobacterium paludis TaxID=1476465 RepID=A0A4R7CU82_9SPHI|nr:hypothetical protein [Sphingobacterium paludis]TDS06582.1 hypothetical protein B0I21_11622 [Sphingobacterium paludis]
MSWTTFTLSLVLAYLIYYVMNLLYDRWLAGKVGVTAPTEEKLYFEDDVVPELITLEEPDHEEESTGSVAAMQSAPAPSTAISSVAESTGGVTMDELVRLAKDNLIEHTRAIPY